MAAEKQKKKMNPINYVYIEPVMPLLVLSVNVFSVAFKFLFL